MRIEGIRCSPTDLGTRWQADVIWEDCAITPRTLEVISPALSPDHPPAAFFALDMLPNALAGREKRLCIDAPLPSELALGLPVAMATLSAWFCRGRRPPEWIAPAGGFRQGAAGRGCGIFLSGGVDSLALLVFLCRHYPAGHPLRPTHAYFVNGMDIGSKGDITSQAAFYQRAAKGLDKTCKAFGLELIPIHTNLRTPGLARSSWPKLHFGMAMAGLAHAMSHQVAHMHIASGVSTEDGLLRHGSHPNIEPFCSTSEIQIHLGLLHMTRSQRVALLAEEPAALQSLRVCWEHIRDDGPLNCSQCHKCMLTMMALVACGKLADCPTFAHRDVTPAMARASLFTHQKSSLLFFRDLQPRLAEAGRHDLVEVLEEKIRATRRSLSPAGRLLGRLRKNLRRAMGQ